MTESPETREEVEQAAATWIARREGEAWTEADRLSLEAWLEVCASHRVAYYRLSGVWAQVGNLRGFAVEQSIGMKPSIQVAARAGKYRRLFPYAVAASLLAAVVATLYLFDWELFERAPARSAVVPLVAQNSSGTPGDGAVERLEGGGTLEAPIQHAPFQQTLKAAVGERLTIPLPDGSRVTLDTGSEIRVLMDERSRIVDLDHGQAFFEVAHDPQRVFIVRAGRFSAIAVGTAFSVRRESATLKVVVAEGTVRLEHQGRGVLETGAQSTPVEVVLLPAGGIAREESDAMEVRQVQATEIERDLSWRRGILTFRGASLADAVAEFNRYGTQKIVIADPAIASIEIGGVFQSNSAETFARLLERVFPINAAVQADHIELTARGPQ